jgi:hypothetical protein
MIGFATINATQQIDSQSSSEPESLEPEPHCVPSLALPKLSGFLQFCTGSAKLFYKTFYI